VLTVTQFEAYFGREAQAWEALTYGKLRFVAGDRGLAEKVIQQTRVLFERFSSNALFVKTLADLRHKLEGTGEPSLKNAPGGLYDIDYLTGCLLIQAGVGLKCGTMRDCIWRCADMGLMSRTLAATLDHAAELFRSVDHSARLVTGRSHAWLPANESARESTFRLAGAMLSEDPGRVEKALAEAHHRVRAAYEDVFGSLA
jgi:glutamine synthetase adenylyltransferase